MPYHFLVLLPAFGRVFRLEEMVDVGLGTGQLLPWYLHFEGKSRVMLLWAFHLVCMVALTRRQGLILSCSTWIIACLAREHSFVSCIPQTYAPTEVTVSYLGIA